MSVVYNFEGQVALVTGAASGMGLDTARAFARAGAAVILADLNAEALGRAVEDRKSAGGKAIGVRCDVADWEDDQALAQAALDSFGRIDAVFANAGFGGPRGFERYEPDFMRDMVLTNVLGVAYTIRATMPALRESRGHLLLTSSLAGRRALKGSLYSASKFAVTAMGEAARQDFDGTGVRVTLIEPGAVDTPFFDNRPKIALQADDIADAVLYAISQPDRVDVNEILIRPASQPN
jgi:NADP-dependent 3-hydroxy acid dehydrogenase YdfG